MDKPSKQICQETDLKCLKTEQAGNGSKQTNSI